MEENLDVENGNNLINVNYAREYFTQSPFKIKQNFYFVGELDWENGTFRSDALTIPMVSKTPVFVKKVKNGKTSNYIYPFLLITKNKANNSLDYNLKVFFSSDIDGVLKDSFHLYNINNEQIINKKKTTIEQSTKTSKNNGCVLWGTYRTDWETGKETLLYTWWECSSDGKPEEEAPGGGGGAETTIDLLGPNVVINNINDYLKCFNLSQSAQLTIYVNQPVPNSPTAYTLGGDVGHTFIAIQQGGIRRVFGFWPETSVQPGIFPSDPAVFGNDQNHYFDVAISKPIDSSQLLDIIGYSINAPRTYNLDTYNCTDFAINIGKLGGLNLSDSYGTWPGGGGSNPGQLGQNIRTMVLPSNVFRQTTSTNSASNNGTCN